MVRFVYKSKHRLNSENMFRNMIVDYFLEDDLNLNHIEFVLNEVGENNIHIPRMRGESTYNEGYMENIVPNYSLSEFKSHFRMSRGSFEVLCTYIAPHTREQHLYINLEKKVCFFIWFLAKQESFLSVSDRFGFNKGTGHYIFKKIIFAISQLKNQFIKWPTPAECGRIATTIQNKSRIPGVVGAVDATHIIIKQPTNNAVDFYNRKEQHSIILQAVCDDEKVFRDILISMPGKLHDARVFRNSPLYEKLLDDPPLLQPEQHILGDAAYPLLKCLLKPYRDNGHLNAQQIRFNEIMSGQRSVIERAFANLKGKWRRLKYLDMSLANLIPQVVMAACILHNFIIKEDAHENDVNDPENIVRDEDNYQVEDNLQDENLLIERNNSGLLKRNYIASLL